MVNMKYAKGIAFAVLMLSVVSSAVNALTINSTNPSGSSVSNNASEAKTFSITVNESANFTWYLNESAISSGVTGTENVATSSYANSSAAAGFWNITVYAVSVIDSSIQSFTWWWTVTNSLQIITHEPAANPTSTQGSTQFFNASANQQAYFLWFIDNALVQDNGTVSASTLVSYWNSTAAPGSHNVTVIANNTNGTASYSWTWTVTASPGPNSVSGLTATVGSTWINWTWTNPSGGNFNYTMVSINGSFYTNTSNNFVNYTSFGVGTLNNISLQTVDTFGDVNSTPVSNQTSTLNTQSGSNVIVSVSGANVTFSQVNGDGNTSVSISSTNLWGPINFTAVGNYYNISLTPAVYSGNITVEVGYTPPSNENAVRLYHWNSALSTWDDITTYLDTTNHRVRGNVTGLSPFVPGVPPGPGITAKSPNATTIETIGSISQNFTVTFNQTVNVTWFKNGSPLFSNTSVNSSSYLSTYPSPGVWNITVTGNNTNGTASYSWNWTVRPKTYAAGNRVWDASKPDQFSLTYTWNPMSFPGFYYDIDSDVGNESITMTMNSYTDRTIKKGNIVYDTTPEEVNFGYSGFGSYQVIGFMADKYFAGYTQNSTPPSPTINMVAKSALGQGQLHKVLIDDDTKRTISVGSTLTLQEGYVLKAKDISTTDRIMLVSLLKDGSEVDSATLQQNQTYVYTKRVGVVSDLPIIMVRFDSVFSGREVQAAFLKGVFQISENPTSVKTGDQYNDMKVTSVGQDKIEMSSANDVSLSRGNTENLMGNIKILVADNNTLRFALSTEKTGTFEVRSTVYRGNDPNTVDTWTPYNFGMNMGKTSVGFYYDLDDGIGNESLRLITLSGRTLSAQNLVYTTTPEIVNFGYSGFGSYQVIGFMADKYFAGYTQNSTPPNPTVSIGAKSALGSGQLHKVLIDDDTKRTISVGSTLTLQEGYVLKAKDISVTDRIMLVSLLKDGNEVDSATLQQNQTYVYTKRVGAVSDLPIIMVRFDSVFSGKEVQAAFLRGVFQISENPTTVKTGDQYNDMKVTSVGQDGITMNNNNAISLDNGRVEQLMGNIKLKVGDTSATDNQLRFYFAVDVTPEMVANQLLIDAPAKATAGDTINIKVTAGGKPADGASVSIGSTGAGNTDTNGSLNYTLPRTMKGVLNITATKLGYLQATKSIEVLEYVDYRLSIDAPANANQFSSITIKVTYNGSAVSGASVSYDNASIGTTDSNGVLNYTLQTSGTHSISASKSGYITAVRDINVRAPYSEYKALDINITPSVVFTNEPALIRSNITNTGTKADTLPVELISNGTAVDNRSVSLAPGETKEINFTRKEALPGNYTVEILGQKGLLVVKEAPLNLLLIGGIATGIGAIVIYLLTAKSKISLEMLRQKLLKFAKKGAEKVTLPGEGKK